MNIRRKTISQLVGKGIGLFLVLLMGVGTVDGKTYLRSMVSGPSGKVAFGGSVSDGVTTVFGHQIESSETSYTNFIASVTPGEDDFYVEQIGFNPLGIEFDTAGNMYVYGGMTLAKYDPNNDLIWVLKEEQLQNYIQIPVEDWKVSYGDMEPKLDGSMDLLFFARPRDVSNSDVWEVYTTGEGPARFMLNISATWPMTINVHSYFSDVEIYLFGRHENLSVNAIDGTQVTLIKPTDKSYEEMKQEYGNPGQGSGNGYQYCAPAGLSDGSVGIDTSGTENSQIHLMNIAADGSLNWIRPVAQHIGNWGWVSEKDNPKLLKTNGQATSVYIPFSSYQYYGSEIILGDGTVLNPDPQPDDSLFYVVNLDESGQFVGYEDFLGKVGPIESLPFDFDSEGMIEHVVGYEGKHYLWQTHSRTHHNVVVLDKDLEVRTILTDIGAKAVKAAFDVEISENELRNYVISSVVGSGSECLVVMYSTAWKFAGTGPLGDFHKYQLFVRFALDGSLIDAVPLQLPKPLSASSIADWEFRIVADAYGNYSYIQADRKALEDQLRLDEYSVEPIGEFMRYLTKNRGPFSGLKTVAGTWRQHWMFGWVSETAHPNWWYSLDMAGFIFVPPVSSDLDFLYYQNEKGWYWTNYELYPYVYSFKSAEWTVVRPSQPF